MTNRYPAPPPVEGAPDATTRTLLRAFSWQVTGVVSMVPLIHHRHGVRGVLRAIGSLVLAAVLLTGAAVVGIVPQVIEVYRLASHTPAPALAAAAYVLALLVVAGLALAIVFAVLTWCTRTRVYTTPDRSTVLAITPTRDGWKVHGFATRARGRGDGRRLAHILVAALTDAADTHGVPVYATTNLETLADLYVELVPGMRVTTDTGGKVTLRRDPRNSE